MMMICTLYSNQFSSIVLIDSSPPAAFMLTAVILLSSLLFFYYYMTKRRPAAIYLVDFACYKPPSHWRVPHSRFTEHTSLFFTHDSTNFMTKVLTSSGQGEETYLPPSLHYIPPTNTLKDAIFESQTLLFSAMENLIHKTNLIPTTDIHILIINCSGFCPSPSLTSLVINRFRIRHDVKSFNLSGMGCSASILAVDTASRLLQVYKNSNAVVLSTEVLTVGWYPGNDHSKLVLNSVFRTGAAAILLTNNKKSYSNPKYKLVTSTRTTTSFNDKSYHSAYLDEDSQGLTGATLNSTTVLEAAREILKLSLHDLGSQILPISEKLKYVSSIITTNLLRRQKVGMISSYNYTPKFKSVIAHFCLPTSGKRLIHEVGKGLGLNEHDIEPALSTLHRFGNQSSSSWWYEMGYIEAKGRMKQGENVLMVGLGSGLKCNCIVWKCLRTLDDDDKSDQGLWDDSIHKYPDKLLKFGSNHVS